VAQQSAKPARDELQSTERRWLPAPVRARAGKGDQSPVAHPHTSSPFTEQVVTSSRLAPSACFQPQEKGGWDEADASDAVVPHGPEIRFNEASEEPPPLSSPFAPPSRVESQQREPEAAAWTGVGNSVDTCAGKPSKISLLTGQCL